MRSRPSLSLHFAPSPAVAGRSLDVRLVIESTSDTPCDAIVIELVGTHSGYEGATAGRRRGEIHFTREHVHLVARAAGRVLGVGRHEERTSFELAPSLLPSHGGSRFPVRYVLSAHVEIPWWPDAQLSTPIVVRPAPTSIERTAPIHRASHRKPTGTELYVEASVGTSELCVGESVDVALALMNVAHSRVQSVDVALVAIETPVFYPSRGPADLTTDVLATRDGSPRDGEIVRVRCTIPQAATPELMTDYFRITHELRVTARVSLGRDVVVSLPVAIRVTADDAPAAGEPVAVGSARKHLHWQKACDALERADVRVEPAGEEDVYTLHVDERAVRIAEVTRDDERLLEAELAWPSLELGLTAENRTWSRLGGLAIGEPFDQRVRVQARELAQVVALFDADLQQSVLAFEKLAWSDTGGTVAVAGTAQRLASLAKFLRDVVQLDELVRDAFARVPPPARLTGALAAHAAFASERRGTLHPGSLSISGLGAADLPLSVERVLEGDGATLVVGGPITDVELPARFVADLEAELRAPVERRPDGAIAVRLALDAEPSAIAAVLDPLRDALAALRRQAGPYR